MQSTNPEFFLYFFTEIIPKGSPIRSKSKASGKVKKPIGEKNEKIKSKNDDMPKTKLAVYI